MIDNMIMRRLFAVLAAMLAAGIMMPAQEREPLPENLRDVPCTVVFSSDDAGSDFRFNDSRKDVRRSECNVGKASDGTPVYNVKVHASSGSQYSTGLSFRNMEPVKEGDVMLARVTLRTVEARQETQECAVYFYFQESRQPYSKSFMTQLCTGTEWKTFYVPFAAHRDFAPGEAAIEFALGALAQTVELTGIEVYDYGHALSVDDLPKTAFSYAGREPDAQWRKDALERIEKIRTAPVEISVTDEAGKPLKGAEVEIAMRRSAFIWGTAVNESALASDDSLSLIYKERLKEYFNTAIIENGFKAAGWAWNADRKTNTLKSFLWLDENGFRQRGHNLVWPGWKFNPRMTRMIAEKEPDAFGNYILAQFHERMAVTKGKVIAWDVVNELMHEKDFFGYMPENGSVVEWFRLAHALDPDAQLFINEYGMLNGAQSPGNIQAYIAKIDTLRSMGAPVQAIGIQGHIGAQPRSPQQVLSDLDLFMDEGLPVQITEFDVDTEDEQLQADYTRDFLIAVYSHPVITGVNLWGFWEEHHWKPAAAMFRKDWSEKPNAAVWRELVKGQWNTRCTGRTDRSGTFSSKGHLGEYTLRVTYGGMTVEKEFNLDTAGQEVRVQVKLSE